MSEAPFATRGSLTREREDTAAGDETQNGESGIQHQHKTNAFLNFFHKSPGPRTTTPRADVSGGADGSGTPGAGRSEEQEMEDHMLGSAYTASELCPACGFPRGSSVCCPVTRRHHGTNELMDSGRHQHSRSASGSKGLFAKILSKFPVSPRRHSERPTPVNDDGGSPSTENHMPSGRDDNAGEVDGAPRHAAAAGVSVSPESASEERLHPRTHHTDGAADEVGGAEAAAPEEGGEEQVQYYCYTDENGETFYYTQELQESMDERQSATAAARASQLETHTDAAAAGHDADAAPPASYLCEYVDENGNTVQYLYTPDPNAAAPPAEEAEYAEAAAATTTSAVAVGGGSDDGSSDAAGATTSAAASAKRKSPSSFFAAITNVFKPGRTSDNRRTAHVDPATTPGGSSGPLMAPGQGTPSAGDEGVDGYAAHDQDVEAHLATLDASEKKKFLKDRKNLVKELASAEKKAREALVKERHEYVEETGRQKRAGAFAMEKVARAVKAGQKRGEPL